MLRTVAILIAFALAAMPAAALAAPADPAAQELLGTPQTPSQNQVGEQPAPVQAPAPVQVDDGTIGSGQLLLIGAGIVALIGGIWFVIARDARRATAGRMHTQTAGGDSGSGRGGSATRSARRSRKMSAAERQRRKRGRAR